MRLVQSLVLMFVAACSVPALADAPASRPAGSVEVITLLHTNDLHGHVVHGNAPGGLARMATLADRVRKEMPHVLVFDSGDIIQSTPTMRLFGGRPIIEAMNRVGFDAAVLGNHEFDFGADALVHAMSLASFPWVIAPTSLIRTATHHGTT